MFKPSFGMRRLVDVTDNVPDLEDDEAIHYSLASTRFQLNNDTVEIGTVFITTKRLIYLGGSSNYDIDIPYIVLHAISKDPEAYPEPCLYCQLGGNDDEENLELEETNELRIIPTEEKDLFPLFEALSYAASINPDPLEPGEENFDEGSDELIFNVEEVTNGAEQARRLQQWDDLLAGNISTGTGGINVNITTTNNDDLTTEGSGVGNPNKRNHQALEDEHSEEGGDDKDMSS